MASQTNVVAVVGRIGADPELRHTTSGKPVANLRLANTRSVKKGENEWEDETSWFSVIVWDRLGELVSQKAKKGDLVTVAGRLQERTWEAEGGEKRSKVEIIANTVEGEFQFRSSQAPAESAAASSADDDIPF